MKSLLLLLNWQFFFSSVAFWWMYFDALPLGTSVFTMGFPCGAGGKESAWQCRRSKKHRFDPWVRKIPWRRAWQPTPVFLPGESPWTEEPGETPQVTVVPDSLWSHGLYSPWNSPGQDTGVGSLSLLQGIFPTQGSNPGPPHCRWTLYQLSHKRRGLNYRITKSLDVGSQSVVHDWATKAHHVSKSCPMMICISVYVLDGNSKLEHSFNNCMVYSGICLLHFLQVMTLRYSFSICLNIWRCIQTILHL